MSLTNEINTCFLSQELCVIFKDSEQCPTCSSPNIQEQISQTGAKIFGGGVSFCENCNCILFPTPVKYLWRMLRGARLNLRMKPFSEVIYCILYVEKNGILETGERKKAKNHFVLQMASYRDSQFW